MAASQRNLARLPLEIFEPFVKINDENNNESSATISCIRTADELRQEICQKLQSSYIPRKAIATTSSSVGNGNNDGVRTVGALLQMPILFLMRVLDPLLTFEQCHELVRRISLHCVPTPVTAWSLIQDYQDENHDPHLPQSHHHQLSMHMLLPMTWLGRLNAHLRGGLRVGTITELVGAAGVGKTQFCLSLVASAALLSKRGSIYIDTTSSSSSSSASGSASASVSSCNTIVQRLQEIAMQRVVQAQQQQAASRRNTTSTSTASLDSSTCVLANVTTQSPRSTEELLSCLESLEEQILLRNQEAAAAASTMMTTTATNDIDSHLPPPHQDSPSSTPPLLFPVGLVVLDSIAAPLQRDFAGSTTTSSASAASKGAAVVLKCAQILKRLAHQLELAVVVVNHVENKKQYSYTHNNPNKHDNNESNSQHQQHQQPPPPQPHASLGTAWHHCVSTRIVLEQQQQQQPLLQPNQQHQQLSGRSAASTSTSSSSSTITPSSYCSRTASVSKSHVVGPGGPFGFQITSAGVVGEGERATATEK